MQVRNELILYKTSQIGQTSETYETSMTSETLARKVISLIQVRLFKQVSIEFVRQVRPVRQTDSDSKLLDFELLDCSNHFFQLPGLPGGLDSS